MGRPMSKKRQDELQAVVAKYYAELGRWYPVDKDGRRVEVDHPVLNVRGEPGYFKKVTAFPEYGKTGKVIVERQGGPSECYPEVYGLTLVREND